MSRHGAADPRQDVAGIPEIERTEQRRARRAELENREPPAGPQHAQQLAARHLGLLHVANAEGDRRARRTDVARRPAGSSHRRAPAGRATSRLPRPQLLEPCASIAPEKSTPTTRARAVAAPAPIATSAVPVQTSSSLSRPVNCSARNRAPAPVAIEAAGQNRVEQVVAAGDRVEHARDLRRRLVRLPVHGPRSRSSRHTPRGRSSRNTGCRPSR